MDTTLQQLLARLGQQPANNDLAHAYGLKINNVSYEDVGRDKNSVVGPNISDMTLTVDDRRMPIIRKPNFSDVTCDLKIADFKVTVGNESKDGELRRIPLTEYIEKLREFNPDTCQEDQESLLIDRDEHLLASAQACVLPLGHGKDSEGNEIKEVEFVPEIFNYQSRGPEPAVMVIVASSQGTSATILTKRAQKLYFNRGGQGVQFLAKRLSLDRKERGVEDKGDMTTEEQDRNLIMVFQIPLVKQVDEGNLKYHDEIPLVEQVDVVYDYYSRKTNPSHQVLLNGPFYRMKRSLPKYECSSGNLGGGTLCDDEEEEDQEMGFNLFNAAQTAVSSRNGADRSTALCCAISKSAKEIKGMENAMLRVSDTSRGAFTGLQKKKLIRDTRFPIRVTLQHYKVSDSPLLSEESVKYIANKIKTIYDNAEAQGSLVVGGSKESNQARPTEIRKAEVRPMPNLVNLSDNPMFNTHKHEDEWCAVSA